MNIQKSKCKQLKEFSSELWIIAKFSFFIIIVIPALALSPLIFIYYFTQLTLGNDYVFINIISPIIFFISIILMFFALVKATISRIKKDKNLDGVVLSYLCAIPFILLVLKKNWKDDSSKYPWLYLIGEWAESYINVLLIPLGCGLLTAYILEKSNPTLKKTSRAQLEKAMKFLNKNKDSLYIKNISIIVDEKYYQYDDRITLSLEFSPSKDISIVNKTTNVIEILKKEFNHLNLTHELINQPQNSKDLIHLIISSKDKETLSK
ncbi:hypothetical protein LVJ85_08130 [Neisseria sp. Dent CA1/247]|uniref:hypothetical protein n=1 Tax=Neisseria sp. Dent CA1/247 TaxID=2912675 RepID=UPI001FD0CA46|nr:hypothetical protein [Neisseria sp. Dent CA1/247]UOO76015.1 hypothetical protein LVJ85_08130 [Neisseria sp. Dent CA1/247]